MLIETDHILFFAITVIYIMLVFLLGKEMKNTLFTPKASKKREMYGCPIHGLNDYTKQA